MTEEEIDTSDIPPLTEEFFKRAKIRLPNGIRLDPDIVAWFRQQEGDPSERINAVLRQYMHLHDQAA
jgi:uncharacterized protein (DUF4415 family)